MRKHQFILILFVILSTSNTIANYQVTSKQEEIVLEKLNNLCGDSWCEGEYEIIFHDLSQNSSYLKFHLEFEEWIGAENNYKSHFRVCNIEGIDTFEQMITIDHSYDGQYFDQKYILVEKFLHKIDDCILNLETTINN